MNRKQLKTLWVGVAALVLALVYPPWVATGIRSSSREWAWFWSRPDSGFLALWEIDVTGLCMEAAFIGVITAALIVSFRGRRSS